MINRLRGEVATKQPVDSITQMDMKSVDSITDSSVSVPTNDMSSTSQEKDERKYSTSSEEEQKGGRRSGRKHTTKKSKKSVKKTNRRSRRRQRGGDDELDATEQLLDDIDAAVKDENDDYEQEGGDMSLQSIQTILKGKIDSAGNVVSSKANSFLGSISKFFNGNVENKKTVGGAGNENTATESVSLNLTSTADTISASESKTEKTEETEAKKQDETESATESETESVESETEATEDEATESEKSENSDKSLEETMSATEEQRIVDDGLKQYCGGYDIDKALGDDYSESFEGGAVGDFNSFIKNLYGGIKATKGGKKRVYSPEATEINNKITEAIKKVYPNITKEEIKAVRFVLYQPIRNKYEPEVFKTLTDVEKSKMLLKAATEKAIKAIDLHKAVADRKAKLDEIFGHSNNSGEGTITPDEEQKEKKKSKKTSKAKKSQRGGSKYDSETIELPFSLKGGCNCGHH